MIRANGQATVVSSDGISRRGFLQAGSAALTGLALPGLGGAAAAAAGGRDERSAIVLFLVGGPSHLDTFDPKPEASSEVRGPYKAIRTNVPGILLSEILPRTARIMDKVALVRSMYHTAAGVHDTGHQMMQTGRLFQSGVEQPHIGSVMGYLRGAKGDLPPHVLLPRPIGNTGGNMPHGQTAGYLGEEYEPFVLNGDPDDLASSVASRLMTSPEAREAFDVAQEPESLREAFGRNPFGQGCLLARRLVERGVRVVTVNMFETVFNAVTWDIHGAAPFSPIEAYGTVVGPMFDRAYSMLISDLERRGLLKNTMVVAMGEFGRTPRLNPAGGRDHWPHCWTTLFAGGGVKGGQAVGSSDEIGAYPKERPTTPAEVVATVYHSLGVDLRQPIPGPEGQAMPVVDAGVDYIRELF